jgi:WD40 repeat protein
MRTAFFNPTSKPVDSISAKPILAALMTAIFAVVGICQTQPAQQDPAPQQRGVGLSKENEQQSQSQGQSKSMTQRPELVLQTGYAFLGPSGVAFSPDGRLLATTAMNSSEIKLWDAKTGNQLRTLVGGGTDGTKSAYSPLSGISALAFSRDSQLIAAGTRDNSIRVWDVTTGREVQKISQRGGSITATILGVHSLAFSPDSKRLLTVDNSAKVYDVSSGDLLESTEVGTPADIPTMGAFFPSNSVGGQMATIVREEGTSTSEVIKLIDMSTGHVTRSIPTPDDLKGPEGSMVFAAADGRLILVSMEGDNSSTSIKLWDLSSKERGKTLATFGQGKYAVFGFSHDGRTLAMAIGNNAGVWDTSTGKQLKSFEVPNRYARFMPQAGVSSISFNPDNSVIATSGFDTQIIFWDANTLRPLKTMKGQANPAYEPTFSNDGSKLFAGGKTVWDLQGGRGLRASSSSAEAPMGKLSPDGKTLAIRNGNDNKILLFDVAGQREIATLAPAQASTVNEVAFSPDGRLVATTYNLTDEERQKRVTTAAPSISSGDMQKAMKEAMKASKKDPMAIMRAYNQALSKSSNAAPDLESDVLVWDAATGRQVQTIVLPSTNPFAPSMAGKFAFSADGRTIAATSLNSPSVSLWDVSTGKQVQTFGEAPASDPLGMVMGSSPLGGASVGTIGFSSDGKLMAVGVKEVQGGLNPAAMMTMAQQSARNPKNKNNNEDYDKMVQNMMNDAKAVGVIKLFDVSGGKQISTINSDASEIKALAFSADGQMIAAANSENVITIWEALRGRQLRTFKGPSANINSVAFDKNSSLLVSTGEDGGTVLWDVKTGQQLATLVSLGDGSEWLAVTPDGLFDGSPGAWSQIMWRFSANTFDVQPVEVFFNEFFSPGLLSDIVAGKRPQAPRDVAQIDRRQPQLQLAVEGVTQSGGQVSARNVKVKVIVADAPAGARDVRLFRNGSLVRAWRGDVFKGQSSTTLEAEIPAVAGENRLSAYAFNQDNVKSVDAEFALNGADALKRTGTAYIVAVGVNRYENEQYNLKYAVADAQSFSDEVRKQQNQLGRYSKVQVIPLLDDQATKENFLSVLRRLAGDKENQLPLSVTAAVGQLEPAQPEDAVIIYYAGHGTARGQRFYLVPHDLGYTGDRNQLDEASLRSILSHSISDVELEQALESLDASQLLLVIDACNSAQALESEEKRRGPMNSKGLAQLAYEKGVYILTAAQSYQAALEAAKFGHGFLTYALIEEGLKQVKADDDPADGSVFVREWFDYATAEVPRMQEEEMQKTRGLNFGSAPVESGSGKVSRDVQRPRPFYRRELESNPLVVASVGGKQ